MTHFKFQSDQTPQILKARMSGKAPLARRDAHCQVGFDQHRVIRGLHDYSHGRETALGGVSKYHVQQQPRQAEGTNPVPPTASVAHFFNARPLETIARSICHTTQSCKPAQQVPMPSRVPQIWNHTQRLPNQPSSWKKGFLQAQAMTRNRSSPLRRVE